MIFNHNMWVQFKVPAKHADLHRVDGRRRFTAREDAALLHIGEAAELLHMYTAQNGSSQRNEFM